MANVSPHGPATTDAFVGAVLRPLLIVLFVLFLLPTALIAFVLYDTRFFSEETDAVLLVLRGMSALRGTPQAIGGPLLQFVPAMVAAYCFSSSRSELSWTGRFVFIITLLVLGLSIFELAIIDPENTGQALNISGGKTTLQSFVDIARFSRDTAIVYMGMLTGFAVKGSGGG